MSTKRPRSLRAFAKESDPFNDMDALQGRLRMAKSESRHLEWKLAGPFGPSSTPRNKARIVKAAISFANWEGGFILFGVRPSGDWVGLSAQDLADIDPAKITELLSGCVFPELPMLNYTEFSHKRKQMAVLHIPPSNITPHVTTKQLIEKDDQGKQRTLLAKHAVYCRQGAKSDLATPLQHRKIADRTADRIRDELVRRVKEVTVQVPTDPQASGNATQLRYSRVTEDPDVPAIRLTRRTEPALGTFLHEELPDGIFDEINNVVDANRLIAGGAESFVLGEPVYFRIYAERKHVATSEDNVRLLATAGICRFYAPAIYWLLKLPPEIAARAVFDSVKEIRNPQVYGLIRIAILLGSDASDWLWNIMEKQWAGHAQPPDYYWTFKKLRVQPSTVDRRLVAGRVKANTSLELPGQSSPVEVSALLEDTGIAMTALSEACMEIFQGEKSLKSVGRVLDILAYGESSETLRMIQHSLMELVRAEAA